MACICSLNGIPRDCIASPGGIKRAWIACYDDVEVNGITVSADEQITEIDAVADSFKEFVFKKQTGSFTTTITKDETTGVTYFDTEIILQFLKQETAKRTEIATLAVADVAVIIQDNNDNFWYFGYSNPVTLSTGTGETGTAFGDFNGYNLTLMDESFVMPYEVTEAAMIALGLIPDPNPVP